MLVKHRKQRNRPLSIRKTEQVELGSRRDRRCGAGGEPGAARLQTWPGREQIIPLGPQIADRARHPKLDRNRHRRTL